MRKEEFKYIFSFLVLLFVIFFVDIIIYIYELPEPNSINNLQDILWWNIVTLTTVGYGDMYPTTIFGRIASVVMMICGIAIFAYIVTGMLDYIIDFRQKRVQGLLRTKMKDHIVIFNWNERALELVKELENFNKFSKKIVIIDNILERSPLENITFIKGNPSQEETLHKANIKEAVKGIILASYCDKATADANTVLTTLAVRNINEKMHLCAEVLSSANITHLKKAKVDEIIDINSIVSRFMAQTVSDPKILDVLKELISNENNSFKTSRVKVKEEAKDLKHLEMLTFFKESHDALLIAIENPKTGEIIINPSLNTYYKPDFVFVISEKQIN